ncbi:MAG: metallophosphoesterase [Defluviitaleaceae bacterium]|nr:metallophosphoesterase [Defluviitaleaceae bacterium]
MKVLVVSDSHGDSEAVHNLLNRYKLKVQMVVHLGDNAKDLLQYDTDYPAIDFVAVAGNCDFYGSLPGERILTIGDAVRRRVLLLHGHKLNVKSNYDRLMYYAQEREVDACLFGHSHMPFVHVHESVFSFKNEERPRLFFMNPGSVSEPRGGSKAGYGILFIDDAGNITGEVYEL